MKGKKCLQVFLFVMFLFQASLSFAETTDDIGEMKRRIDVLAEEIEKLKLGGVAEPKYESFSGLGPAASKVYGIDKGLSIGGYGELVYLNYMEDTKKDFADAYRFILYGGYKFTDRIIMNAELEFEHAGIKNVGTGVAPTGGAAKQAEVYVEFMYLDFLLKDSFNLRTGLMLVPIGLTNEFHEPTVFNSVLRPDVELNIIPTTWRDIGIMAYGDIGKLKYNLALINGLRADKFKNSTWIRDGRQQGAEVNADVWAWVGRLNYEVLSSLTVGGSYYTGNAGHGKGGDTDPLGADEKKADVKLYEAHLQYQHKGFQFKGLYAEGSLDGNAAFEAAPPGGVGKKAKGWYAEAGYDVMPHIMPGEMSLTPFVRYESYNTTNEVFTGARDKTFDRTVMTAGLAFKPHSQVVVKADYQRRDTESGLPAGKGTGLDENKIDQFNMGIGFIF